MTELNANTIGLLDGGAAEHTINEAITEVLRDCDLRPALDKARKVTIELSIKPVRDDSGFGSKGVETTFTVKSTVPAITSRTLYMKMKSKNNQITASITDGDHQTPDMFETEGNITNG